MQTDKKNKSIIAVYAIAAVIYILAFAVVPFPKNSAAAWISFLFTVLAFGASFYITQKAFYGDAPIVSKVYGYPIFRIGIIYLAVQVVFSLIILTIGFFAKVSYWIALLPSVVFLGLAAIGFIAADNARDMVEEIDEESKIAVKAVEMFNADIAGIIDLCENAEVKKELETLAENLRFSDPVSGKATKNIEITISEDISELRDMITSGNSDKITVKIKEIKNLLNERNRICKTNK